MNIIDSTSSNILPVTDKKKENLESTDERRGNHWKLDKSINISACIAGLVIFWTVISYGNAIIEAQRVTGQKVNIMWEYFIKDKPELTYLFK